MKRSVLVLVLLTLMAVVSPATAAPPQPLTTTWTGMYYANRNLEGDPVLVRNDANIDFAWANGTPDPSLPADNFSARWMRWVYVDTPGEWTFSVIADDGIRLYVDDALILDSWEDQTVAAHTTTASLTQAYHLVQLDYYDRSGNAQVHFQSLSAAFPDWRGEYFDNVNLSGTPTFVRNDSTLNLNFGTAGPGGGVSGSNFSARWTRALYLEPGRYRFSMLSDDGTRVWVDQQLLVDKWRDQMPATSSGEIALTGGLHWVRVEYYNRGGTGQASLSWAPLGGSGLGWHGDYYDNSNLAGAIVLSRDHNDLNFEWGTNPPGPGVTPGPNWSARFTSKRTTTLAGYYTIMATADDGVRVWLDNNLLIDQWHDQPPTTYAATAYLAPGAHDWRVDFYQHGGSASLRVQIAAGVSVPSLSLSALPTATSLVVEENGAGFIKGGDPAIWRDSAGGSGAHAFTVQNQASASSSYAWARWYPRLALAGNYQVEVFMPEKLATTRNARYWIHHNDEDTLIPLNASLYSRQWVSLDTLYFAATGDEYVSLDNTTYEPSLSTVLAVDAVRFVLK